MLVAPSTTLSAANNALTISTNINLLGAGNSLPIAAVKLNVTSNTGVSAVWAVEQLPSGSTVWQGIGFIDTGALTYNSGGSNFSGSDSGNYSFLVPVAAGTDQIRLRLVSIGSGTLTATGAALYPSEVPLMLFPVTTSASSTAQTITSTSATALAVGANGTTNPVFSVNANTASVATGLTVIGAAAAAGVALTVISSGTNEALKINAKGSGAISLGDTSTGPVYVNRGALAALQCGLTLTALGTAQSSTPTSAQLLGGFLTQTGSTGAGTITLPTGTALSTACNRTPATGDSFRCVVANLGGGQTLTVTGATGTTVVSGGAIATAKTAVLDFICTGSNAWSIAVSGG